MTKATGIVIVIGMFVAGAAVAAFLYRPSTESKPALNNKESAFTSAVNGDTAFADAVALFKNEQYDEAAVRFRDLYTRDSDPKTKFAYSVYVGLSLQRAGKCLQSLPYFKQEQSVAGDPENLRARASAIQWLANTHECTQDSSVTNEIFSGPYASMRVPGSDSESFRHLYEYAVSVYPIAESEYRIAYWYAIRLLQSKAAQSSSNAHLSPEKSAEYLDQITRNFNAATQDITNLQQYGTEIGNQLASAMERKALVLGALNLAGDESLGKAETIYSDLVKGIYGDRSAILDLHIRYKYARFLAMRYENSRSTDIQDVLKPLYANPTAASFLKNSSTGSAGYKAGIVAITKADPLFKTLLMTTFGWTDADFTLPKDVPIGD